MNVQGDLLTPRPLFMAQMNAERFRPDFIAYLADNLHIWKAFECEALLIAQRRKHYSARTLVEVLRHHSALQEHGSAWKINDWWTPNFARLFELMHPQHTGLFEFREAKAARREGVAA